MIEDKVSKRGQNVCYKKLVIDLFVWFHQKKLHRIFVLKKLIVFSPVYGQLHKTRGSFHLTFHSLDFQLALRGRV